MLAIEFWQDVFIPKIIELNQEVFKIVSIIRPGKSGFITAKVTVYFVLLP